MAYPALDRTTEIRLKADGMTAELYDFHRPHRVFFHAGSERP